MPEELERDALPRGEGDRGVLLRDVVPQRGVAVLHAVLIAGLVVAVHLHYVGEAQLVEDLKLLLETCEVSLVEVLLRSLDGELDAVVGVHVGVHVGVGPAAHHLQLDGLLVLLQLHAPGRVGEHGLVGDDLDGLEVLRHSTAAAW